MIEALTTIRAENLVFGSEQLRVLMPFVWLTAGIILMILGSVTKKADPKWNVFLLSIIVAIGGGIASFGLMGELPSILFNGMLISDPYSNFFNLVFFSCFLLTTLCSFRYLDNEKLQSPEYYVLLLFSVSGMMFMVSSLDLLMVFISLELMSFPVYMLVGFRRADRRSNEASLKYFILGGVASAVLLYGVALIYGVTGTTQIKSILEFVQRSSNGLPILFTLGSGLILCGFLFKIASVPFHMWMPDVYEGAPTPVTGFMTTGLKAASFAAFIRVFISLGYGQTIAEAMSRHMHDILWISAVLTMFLGNLIALTQHNLKRMLAYSSIAHTGYLLIGILSGAASQQGYAPVVLYLVSYSIMNMGAFAILTVLSERADEGLNLQDLAGISKRHPWLAFSMAVFLFSMAGIPPTAGFIGKYLLFYSAIEAGEIALVILGVLSSAISVYFYLRVLVYMYMRDPVGSTPQSRISIWASAAVGAMVILTLQIGVLPSGMIEAVKRIVHNL